MTQILVTGMHRSGTTLCFDLLRRHPDVVRALNEGVVFDRLSGQLMAPPFYSNEIDGDKSRPGARPGRSEAVEFDQDPRACTWLAKMSYPGPIILQEWCASASEYVAAWLTAFSSSARVVHVVRHPFAVFGSAHQRWGADPVHLTNYGPISLESVCRDWAIAVGDIEKSFAGDDRVLTVRYEDLVGTAHRSLGGIFSHCGLAADATQVEAILGEKIAFFGRVEASRAHAHREVALQPISRSTSWLMTPWFGKWGYSDL